jgi:hypothetical protein
MEEITSDRIDITTNRFSTHHHTVILADQRQKKTCLLLPRLIILYHRIPPFFLRTVNRQSHMNTHNSHLIGREVINSRRILYLVMAIMGIGTTPLTKEIYFRLGRRKKRHLID